MKPGDQIVIGGTINARIRAIRTREEIAEIAPLLSATLAQQLQHACTIRAALVTSEGTPNTGLLIETGEGWQTADGKRVTVQLLSEARPC